MEQQIVLKRDYDVEMQYKWKSCVRMTCYAFRTVEWLKDFIDRALEVIKVYIESLKNVFSSLTSSLTNSLSECFEDLSKRLFKPEEEYVIESYPHIYPQYVNNLKVNTIGFPRPIVIVHCARSRC